MKNKIGECPIWDDQRQALYWVDIDNGELYILTIKSSVLKRVSGFGEKISAFALCESGKRLLVACASRFGYYYLDTAEFEPLQSAYKQRNDNQRLNDGRCDKSGRFLVGEEDFFPKDAPTNEKSCNFW